jgi:hypothetical protein
MTPCILVSNRMEVGGSFQSLVLTYQTVLRHSAKDNNPDGSCGFPRSSRAKFGIIYKLGHRYLLPDPSPLNIHVILKSEALSLTVSVLTASTGF